MPYQLGVSFCNTTLMPATRLIDNIPLHHVQHTPPPHVTLTFKLEYKYKFYCP